MTIHRADRGLRTNERQQWNKEPRDEAIHSERRATRGFLVASQRPSATPEKGDHPENAAGRHVWIVSRAAPHSGLGFEVTQVFASEHSALYHVEDRYGAAPVLDETGSWNGSAATGPQREIAIQRFNVEY